MRAAMLLLVLWLGACSRADPSPVKASAPEDPAAPEGGSAAPVATASYLGRWAARAEDCTQFAWTLSRGELDAPGEVFCRYPEPQRSAGGYQVQASCSGEAEVLPGVLDLTMTGADGLTLSHPVFGRPHALVRCPPDPGSD